MSVPEIAGYTDLVQVARGGFGIVYRARREHLDQDVALKVLALADLSERDLERFQRECRAAGNLSWHPNVVAVYDSGITADGHPYLAMEYLDSGTLADRLTTDGPLPWQEVLDAGIQVTGALGAAHAAGTLHRDLKPENILVGPFGEAKLGDFGIAAVEGGSRTATGHASYTVTHVAPEILRGQRPDERSDLYGLASTLFTLLTGRTPFAGDDPDEPIAAIITRALTEPAPHLTGIPEDLADLLEQTLSKDPDERPQTAQAFGQALQQIQRDNGLQVTDLRLGRKTPAPKPTTGNDTPQGDSRRTIHVAPTPPVEPVETREPGPADPNATITVGPTPTANPEAREGSPPPPPPTKSDETPPSPEPPASERTRSKTPLLIGLGVVAVLALTGAAFLVQGGGGSGSDMTGDTGNPLTGTLTAAPGPAHIAATSEDLWVVDEGDGGLTRYDASSGRLISSEDVTGGSAIAVTSTADAAWVVTESSGLLRVDRDTLEVTDEVEGVTDPIALDATSDAVWLLEDYVGGAEPELLRIDAATAEVSNVISDVGFVSSGSGFGAFDLAVTGNAVWVTTGHSIVRVDPSTFAVVATIDPSTEVVDTGAIAATQDVVWVLNVDENLGLYQIDPATNEVEDFVTLDVRFDDDLAATTDAAWVTTADGLVRFDQLANEIVDTVDLGARPSQVVASGEDVWLVTGDEVQHIDAS